MRIGLFTDSYHPASNGVVVIVDATRRFLEELGHEVFVFAPDGGVVHGKLPDDPNIIRLPALQYDLQFSLFFPPALLARIKALHLDIIQFFTPAQVGLIAVLAARLTDTVMVGKHSTDTYEFSQDYRAMMVSYVICGPMAPIFVKMSPERIKALTKLYFSPHSRKNTEKWSQRLIAGLMAMLYASCDAVVAGSQKSGSQLTKFADRVGEKLNLYVIPDGVDSLPPPAPGAVQEFRHKWGIEPDDEVVVNFGRLAEEKNQPLLIKMMATLIQERPQAKLLLAGDYVFRDKLEQMAAQSPAADRIVFSGRYERTDLSTICAVSSVFAFPSMKDTQGIVLNEAAGCGLPLVMCDKGVNDVFKDGVNGLQARNDPADFATKVAQLLGDDETRARFGERSKELATQYSGIGQTEKLAAMYSDLLSKRQMKTED